MDNQLRKIATTIGHVGFIIQAIDEHTSQRTEFSDDPEVFRYYQSLIYMISKLLNDVSKELESMINGN